MQLVSSVAQTNAVVCSTLMEAWRIANSGLVEEGIVKDVSVFITVKESLRTEMLDLIRNAHRHQQTS